MNMLGPFFAEVEDNMTPVKYTQPRDWSLDGNRPRTTNPFIDPEKSAKDQIIETGLNIRQPL